ncbi:MAG: imidazoleglycerol-phosphate dehydratase HisB [Verrucomicrobiota bacterium]
MRKAAVERKTRETDIRVALFIEGAGRCDVETGIPFMDHMLELLGRHSLMDLTVKASGDLEVDYHHTVEDLGLVLGEALDKALGQRRGITRFGWSMVPMDESLSRVVIDLGGRPFLVYEMACRKRKIRDFDLNLINEFFRAFCTNARMNLHICQLYGSEPHHAHESVFKAVARALRLACAVDEDAPGVPSTKGKI